MTIIDRRIVLYEHVEDDSYYLVKAKLAELCIALEYRIGEYNSSLKISNVTSILYNCFQTQLADTIDIISSGIILEMAREYYKDYHKIEKTEHGEVIEDNSLTFDDVVKALSDRDCRGDKLFENAWQRLYEQGYGYSEDDEHIDDDSYAGDRLRMKSVIDVAGRHRESMLKINSGVEFEPCENIARLTDEYLVLLEDYLLSPELFEFVRVAAMDVFKEAAGMDYKFGFYTIVTGFKLYSDTMTMITVPLLEPSTVIAH